MLSFITFVKSVVDFTQAKWLSKVVTAEEGTEMKVSLIENDPPLVENSNSAEDFPLVGDSIYPKVTGCLLIAITTSAVLVSQHNLNAQHNRDQTTSFPIGEKNNNEPHDESPSESPAKPPIKYPDKHLEQMSHRTQESVHQVEDLSQKFVIPEPTKNIGILEDEKLEKGVEELKHDETEMDLCRDQIKALSNVRDVLTEEVLELQNKLSDVKD